MERLYDMDDKEIGAMIRHPHGGKVHNMGFIYNCEMFPIFESGFCLA